MKTQITLDSKEVRKLVARSLNIPEEKVIPLRYNFAIEGYSESEVQKMLADAGIELE